MGKLLLLLLLAVAAYLFWQAAARKRARDAAPKSPPEEAKLPERMVGCSHCGLHLPLSDAIESQGRYFCSEEHRRLFVR